MNKLILKIIVRALFVLGWFILGYFPYNDAVMGLFSAVCALILMETCYFIDRKTSGIDKIIERIDFLDETLEESQKTESLIL